MVDAAGADELRIIDATEAIPVLWKLGAVWYGSAHIGAFLRRTHDERHQAKRKMNTNDLLAIYDVSIRDNPVTIALLRSAHNITYVLSFRVYRSKPGQISQYCIPDDLGAQRVLVVGLWEKESRVRVYLESNSKDLPHKSISDTGFMSVPSDDLKGCREVEITLEEGGVTFFDIHTCFEVLDGKGILLAFGSDQLKRLSGEAPGLEDSSNNTLRRQAQDLQIDSIRLVG